MRYCHECGAIIAPEDTFCSYCGITLEPMSASMLGEVADTPAANISGNIATHEEPLDDFAAGKIQADSTPAEIAGQTDLAVDAAIQHTPLPAEPTEDKAVSFDSVYNFKPVLKSEDAPAAPPSNELTANAATPPPPAALPDEFADDEPEAGEVEPETFFGYPLPVASSSEKAAPQSAAESSTDDVSDNKSDDAPFEPATVVGTSVPEPPSKENEYAEDMQATLIGGSVGFDSKPAASENQISQSQEENDNEPPTIIGGNVSQDIRLEGTEQRDSSTSLDAAEQSQNFELQVGESIPGVQHLANSQARQTPEDDAKSRGETAGNEPERVPRQTEANRPQETPGNAGSKAQKLKPLIEGTLLNRRYKIVRRIGGGGMGAVYLAEDQNLGGVLRAVKEMIQAYVDESQQEKAVQDFRRESVLLTQLDHSAIPTIYDYFFDEVNARFYLVMKYISGGDLAARLRAAPEGKLDEGSITEWAIQIADVLDYLHRRDPPIVYRDLKPSNIMLDGSSQNKAMLIDFGIARWVNKEEKGVTAVGTMGYAPPELFAGNAEPRSDIYSLGATMFHLLTGADPQSNPLLIFDFTKNPRPRQINMMVSVEMEDILLRAVEYNSGLRFESAAKMRDALREHLDKLRAGRLTFERKANNVVQAMPLPAQPPPAVPFDKQPQVNMVFCGFCGEKIIANDSFCAYCGAPQQNPPAQKSSAAQNQPSNQMQQTMMPSNAPPPGTRSAGSGAATARLVVLGTNELDAPLFPLEKETNLVGREDRSANIFPEVDLTRYDTKAQVSRRHARIWHDGANFLVEDLRSSNGTILIGDNDKTVRLQAHQPHVLQHGDKLRLGETTLRFYVN